LIAGGSVISARSRSKNFDHGPGNSGVLSIRDCAGDASPLRLEGIDLAQCCKRDKTNKKSPEKVRNEHISNNVLHSRCFSTAKASDIRDLLTNHSQHHSDRDLVSPVNCHRNCMRSATCRGISERATQSNASTPHFVNRPVAAAISASPGKSPAKLS
jgi:hypothetical protein